VHFVVFSENPNTKRLTFSKLHNVNFKNVLCATHYKSWNGKLGVEINSKLNR